MASRIAFADTEVGSPLPSQSITLRRVDLVRYAGASGDFNVIHWNERAATEVGLPNVIAHGMLTMAEAIRVITDWCGDPGAVVEYSSRFTRPVPVPDDDAGATVEIQASVIELLDDRCVKVELVVTCEGAKVLGMARAVVKLS
jgi:acyl dehydratase